MTDIIRCEQCHRPIAVGRLEAGQLDIKCHRCGYKTRIVPAPKAHDIVATNRR